MGLSHSVHCLSPNQMHLFSKDPQGASHLSVTMPAQSLNVRSTYFRDKNTDLGVLSLGCSVQHSASPPAWLALKTSGHCTHLDTPRSCVEKQTECWRRGGGATARYKVYYPHNGRSTGTGLPSGRLWSEFVEDKQHGVLRATRDLSKTRRFRPGQSSVIWLCHIPKAWRSFVTCPGQVMGSHGRIFEPSYYMF